MGLRIQYWLSTALAGILLILVLANAWFYQGNVERQTEFSNRQAIIQQASQLEGLNREILQALANLSVGGKGDKQIEQMLASLGIKVNVEASNPPQSPPPSPVKTR